MGQVRHGSAATTHAIRAAIQRSKASLATLSRELGINPKTVAKWRKRQTLEDMKTGPKEPRSTVLTAIASTKAAQQPKRPLQKDPLPNPCVRPRGIEFDRLLPCITGRQRAPAR